MSTTSSTSTSSSTLSSSTSSTSSSSTSSSSMSAVESNKSYPNVTKKYLHQMQMDRFEIFKAQDLENGHFDVIFEIEGKMLYANKFILTPASEPFNSWLSDRWNAKDEPIQIKSCTYDIFYQFVCFIYNGQCEFTNENIFQLVDVAECFRVPCLKELCEEFLCDMKKTVENVQEMYEFAVKYAMTLCTFSISNFIRYGESDIFKAEKFLEYDKSFVEFLSTYNRIANYSFERSHPLKESEYFKLVYDWAEYQVQKKQKPVDDENFNLEEAIKIELQPILPNIKFSQMNFKFLMNFVLEKGFILSATELCEFFKRFRIGKPKAKEENLFKYVYFLAEKQALIKQSIAAKNDETFDVANSIKADLSEVLPYVVFYKMDETFLNDFVVRNGLITEEEASRVYDWRVEIKNNGKTIYGSINGRFLHDEMLPCIGMVKGVRTTRIRFCKFRVPKTPSTVTKMKGIDWYLCLEADGTLSLKHHIFVGQNDYLLAEMKSDIEFKINPKELTHLSITNDINMFAK